MQALTCLAVVLQTQDVDQVPVALLAKQPGLVAMLQQLTETYNCSRLVLALCCSLFANIAAAADRTLLEQVIRATTLPEQTVSHDVWMCE